MAGRSPSEDMRLGPKSPFLMAPFCTGKSSFIAIIHTFLYENNT